MEWLGAVFSLIAGAAMSVQGVFNTRLSDKIGLYESNMFVQGTAFALSLVAMLVLGKGNLGALGETNKLYWLGGVLGIIITITVMLGMQHLGPTLTVSLILVAQLFVAALIDALGLFGTEKIPFSWTNWLGMALMVAGIVVFKLKL